MGELADFGGAKYDGDFSLSLAEAQRRKHEYVAEQTRAGAESRVLDVGCGWGALLDFLRRRGASGVGVTLSRAQLAACRAHGLEVHLRDARALCPNWFGQFEAVTSLGAFEHFCSPEDFRAGHQDELYQSIFGRIAGVLPERGRFYLQTMVYGRNMIPFEQALAALVVLPPPHTDAWYLALLARQFPGSWLPRDHDQLVRCASPRFELLSSSNGRLDYIETIEQWNRRIARRSFRMNLLKLQLVPHWLTSVDFRLAFASGVSANKICFERELLDHYRLVFQKR
jgi:cyclopropane-fatty-acyl-phospholipid synthase